MLVYSGGDDRTSFASRWKETPSLFLFSGWDYQRAQLLKSLGLPGGKLLVEDKARTTDQNARFCAPVIRSLGVKRVTLALPWYHLPRALFLTRLSLFRIRRFGFALRHDRPRAPLVAGPLFPPGDGEILGKPGPGASVLPGDYGLAAPLRTLRAPRGRTIFRR